MLRPGSVDDYNSFVASMQASASDAATALSIQNAEAATALSIQKSADAEAARIERIAQDLVGNITTLDGYVSALPSRLADVTAAIANVSTAATDSQSQFDNCDTAAYYADDAVGFAVDAVQYAIDAVGYTTASIADSVKLVQQGITALTPLAHTDDQVTDLDAGKSAITDAYTAVANANTTDGESLKSAMSIYTGSRTYYLQHCAGHTLPAVTVPTVGSPGK